MVKGTKVSDEIKMPDISDPLVGLPESCRKEVIRILEGEDFDRYFKLVDYTGDEAIGGRHGTKPLGGKRKFALQWIAFYETERKRANGTSAEYHAKEIARFKSELARIDAEIMAICKSYTNSDEKD